MPKKMSFHVECKIVNYINIDNVIKTNEEEFCWFILFVAKITHIGTGLKELYHSMSRDYYKPTGIKESLLFNNTSKTITNLQV